MTRRIFLFKSSVIGALSSLTVVDSAYGFYNAFFMKRQGARFQDEKAINGAALNETLLG